MADTVLVVDDVPQNIELLEAYLVGAGYAVRSATSGEQALKLAQQSPPDLVLLDVMMPGMNGFEVCRHLKANRRTQFVPVVMVTALSGLDDKVVGLEAGADDFVSKPIHKVELMARVKSLVRLKRLHDELEQSLERVLTAERHRDMLMDMIVHDLKNPLSAVMGSLTMLLDGSLGDVLPPQRHLLSNAHRSSLRLMRMIHNLLDISRIEAGKLELDRAAFDLREVVQAVATEVQVMIERNSQKLLLALESPVPVRADKNIVHRVVVNLVDNAIRHTPSGSAITVGAVSSDGAVQVWVADTGPGIPPDRLGEIFERFSPSRDRLNTGLGLTFCKLAAEAHGGRIEVQSQLGAGSKFTLHLPTS